MKIITFISFVFLWLLISGFNINALNIFYCLCASTLTYYISARFKILSSNFPFKYNAINYLGYLFVEMTKSAIKVSYHATRWKINVFPEISALPNKQINDLSLALYASSITLTPGTVTINSSENGLLIHALCREDLDSLFEGEMSSRINDIIK